MIPFYRSTTYLHLRLDMGISVLPAIWKKFIDKVFENSQMENDTKAIWMTLFSQHTKAYPRSRKY